MSTILMRYLKQESTWRGLIGITAACGIQLEPELMQSIVTIALALTGLINVTKNK